MVLVLTLAVGLHGALQALVVALVLGVLVDEEGLQFLLVESPEKALLLLSGLLLRLCCCSDLFHFFPFFGFGGASEEIFDEKRHQRTEDDGSKADHDKSRAFHYRNLIEGTLIVFVGLYGENEREGNGPSDGASDRNNRQFLVCDCPFLGEQLEDDGNAEDGESARDDANEQFQSEEAQREDLVIDVVNHRNAQIDEDHRFGDEGDELEEDPAYMPQYDEACMPPGVRL